MVQPPFSEQKLQEMLEYSKTLKRLSALIRHPAYSELLAFSYFLPTTASIKTRLWHFEHNVTSIPSCKCCPTPVTWRKEYGDYNVYCSSKCAHNDEEMKQQHKNTLMAKYGVDHVSKIPDVREKAKQTLQRKYNVTNPSQIENINEKKKQTSLLRCGFTHHLKDPCTRTQYKGCVREFVSQEALLCLNDKQWLYNTYIIENKTLTQMGEMLGVSYQTVGRFLIYNNIKRKKNPKNLQDELDLLEFVKTLTDEDVEHNNRTCIPPKELDIYVPSKRIAIELNGVYWHSENKGKDNRYHIGKLLSCIDRDIKLISITDIEWKNKQDLVKSKLRSIFGKSQHRVHARKCTVVEVDKDLCSEFLAENHIQGDVGARWRYGLYFEGDLVMVATFGTPRYSDEKGQVELLRMAAQQHTNVIGGASKLISHFRSLHPENSIISYCDRRWGEGIVYQNMGFKFVESTKPSYYYFHTSNPHVLYHRSAFMKHKLRQKLKNYDPSKTEWENMKANGYDRIWDCGTNKYILK